MVKTIGAYRENIDRTECCIFFDFPFKSVGKQNKYQHSGLRCIEYPSNCDASGQKPFSAKIC
jgi:hypothetical protein